MDTSKIVGEKIKSLRESQSISMEELAQRSGLAIEQIERIENNIDLPSLAPLIKIARVLGVRLGTFLDDQDENGPVVCRKSEAKGQHQLLQQRYPLAQTHGVPLSFQIKSRPPHGAVHH